MITGQPERAHTYAAFSDDTLLASGDLRRVLEEVMKRRERGRLGDLLLFDAETGKQVEISLERTTEEIVEDVMGTAAPRGPGRPRLGVVSGEVTLLPRHGEWLQRQPQGASATLRRLVDEARRRAPEEEARRDAREAAHRFMTSLGGNRPHYEDALRALYASDREGFERCIRRWPKDVRAFATKLAAASFE